MLCKSFCDVFQPGDHASTFGGNPFATGVALTVCRTLEQENLLGNVQARGEQLRSGLQALAVQHPTVIAEVRGWGLINGLVLHAESEFTSADIVKTAIEQGVLLVPAGPKVVRFVPPLTVSEAEIDQAIAAVKQGIESLA
jgi:acetylornithine aminotransferase